MSQRYGLRCQPNSWSIIAYIELSQYLEALWAKIHLTCTSQALETAYSSTFYCTQIYRRCGIIQWHLSIPDSLNTRLPFNRTWPVVPNLQVTITLVWLLNRTFCLVLRGSCLEGFRCSRFVLSVLGLSTVESCLVIALSRKLVTSNFDLHLYITLLRYIQCILD